jgi:hypothetical protein
MCGGTERQKDFIEDKNIGRMMFIKNIIEYL